MTPSAARGILEAILWKPAIRWVIDRIYVLKPIRYTSIMRNEVKSKIPPRTVAAAMKNGDLSELRLRVDDASQRQQRASTILVDVDYVIEAHFVLTEKAGPSDNVTKFVTMFERRVKNGQCFSQPSLGTREFAARFEPAPSTLRIDPAHRTPELGFGVPRDLGVMLWDIDYEDDPKPAFFRASLKDGVIIVPSIDSPEVLR